MNKRSTMMMALAAMAFSLLSFVIADKKDLIGTWRWVHVKNTQSNETIPVEKMTMSKEVKTSFKEDGTYAESKSKDDGSVSTINGEWKLEEDGKVLSLKSSDKWRPAKIVQLSADSLIVEMRPAMQLVMVKEK
jgi:lipocalin-like protein